MGNRKRVKDKRVYKNPPAKKKKDKEPQLRRLTTKLTLPRAAELPGTPRPQWHRPDVEYWCDTPSYAAAVAADIAARHLPPEVSVPCPDLDLDDLSDDATAIDTYTSALAHAAQARDAAQARRTASDETQLRLMLAWTRAQPFDAAHVRKHRRRHAALVRNSTAGALPGDFTTAPTRVWAPALFEAHFRVPWGYGRVHAHVGHTPYDPALPAADCRATSTRLATHAAAFQARLARLYSEALGLWHTPHRQHIGVGRDQRMATATAQKARLIDSRATVVNATLGPQMRARGADPGVQTSRGWDAPAALGAVLRVLGRNEGGTLELFPGESFAAMCRYVDPTDRQYDYPACTNWAYAKEAYDAAGPPSVVPCDAPPYPPDVFIIDEVQAHCALNYFLLQLDAAPPPPRDHGAAFYYEPADGEIADELKEASSLDGQRDRFAPSEAVRAVFGMQEREVCWKGPPRVVDAGDAVTLVEGGGGERVRHSFCGTWVVQR
ncbi:hypothetical protein EDC01DRAFT_791814 [Geopyxis carbonaria]|nr:hypothetical protein EDC01DRAFT_791814 [Geopyxis carbonaria]